MTSNQEWLYWHGRLIRYWQSLGVNPVKIDPDTGDCYTLANLTFDLEALAILNGISRCEQAERYLFDISNRLKP